MSIHFKFKSSKEYASVPVPGVALKADDLKRAIVGGLQEQL